MGHLWLIGMMGSGKSTIGKRVATALDLPFIDSDDVIVEKSRMTINELFTHGEETFREIEREVITQISLLNDHVVATGGGVVLDDRNVATMTATGTTVLLDTDVDSLTSRIQRSNHRPLATTDADIAAIADARSHLYAAAADAVVDTSHKGLAVVAQEVASCRPM